LVRIQQGASFKSVPGQWIASGRLCKIPETAPLDSPVVISLNDALTLARVLLQKFR
jgi:hypothetical protein